MTLVVYLPKRHMYLILIWQDDENHRKFLVLGDFLT